jgi:Rrf2 family protein
MFCLHRKTDYALIALEHLALRPAEVLSAREIAGAHELPLPMLMKLLKRLHPFGVLRSVRGANGGYQISASLEQITLYDLIRTVEGHDPTIRGGVGQTSSPVQEPILALHDKLRRFLKDVRLSDLIVPGRRIDVLLESVQLKTACRAQNQTGRSELVQVARFDDTHAASRPAAAAAGQRRKLAGAALAPA